MNERRERFGLKLKLKLKGAAGGRQGVLHNVTDKERRQKARTQASCMCYRAFQLPPLNMGVYNYLLM